MDISHAFLHDATIDLLYGAIVLLTFVIIERLVYYVYLSFQTRRIGRSIQLNEAGTAALLHKLKSRDMLSRAVVEYVDAQHQTDTSRSRLEDLSAALYLRVDAKINARLWVLDTIITAAPLLGLLGTILGIMETFNALSAGGISDPEAVSRGIGTALYATAIGIATALYGLVGHSVLRRQSETLIERFKSFLLATTFEHTTTRKRSIELESRASSPAAA